MTTLRFQGVQVTDAGQRVLAEIGRVNTHGCGDVSRGGQALRKLERDGLVVSGYGHQGRSWGWWLTELGVAAWDHLYGWSDAPVQPGDRITYVMAGITYEVKTVNALEVRLIAVGGRDRWTMSKADLLAYWADGTLVPYVAPVQTCPVSIGDVLWMRGESTLATVFHIVPELFQVILVDGRTYTFAQLNFLSRMRGFEVVPRTARHLSRIKSTSGTRRRNRG